MANGPYALVPTYQPRTVGGRRPRLEDHAFRLRALNLAAAGAARRDVSELLGVDASMFRGWLARGKAQPDVEPWGSFSREYLQAERMRAGTCIGIQAQQLRHIANKPAETRTIAELQWVDRLLASSYPIEHGNSAAGTGAQRVAEPEIDAEAWWSKQGLKHDQLRAVFRDPPESIDDALFAEHDAIHARALARGWKPPELRAAKPVDNPPDPPQG